MSTRFRHLLFVILLILAGGVAEVSACICGKAATCERFNNAGAIFVGEAIEVIQENRGSWKTESTIFHVKERFLGPTDKEIRVQNKSGFSCDVEFKKGETYLIFAGGSEAEGFGTGFCNGNLPIAFAEKELGELRTLLSSSGSSRVRGFVTEEYSDPSKTGPARPRVPGVQIVIKDLDSGKTYSAVTDENGWYEVTVPPGRYKAEAILPEYAVLRFEDDPVTVRPNGCAENIFVLAANNRITGIVLDALGQPVKNVRVELVEADKARSYSGGRDDESRSDGSFSFEKVPKGRYTLSVNFNSSPDPSNPFPTFFFPGVSNRAEAKVIEIGLTTSINNLVLSLPPRLGEIAMAGKVVWEDGTPAADAEIHLFDMAFPGFFTGCYFSTETIDDKGTVVRMSRSGPACELKSDTDGTFEVSGYSTRSYAIEASITKNIDGKPVKFSAKSKAFAADSLESPIRLVLIREP